MTSYLTMTKQSVCICFRVTIIIGIQLPFVRTYKYLGTVMPTMLTCVGKEAYAMLVPMALLRIFQCAPLW